MIYILIHDNVIIHVDTFEGQSSFFNLLVKRNQYYLKIFVIKVYARY